ncbi:hypothetical protein BH09PSE6_BH09PSE6_22160 [soil metagenome]
MLARLFASPIASVKAFAQHGADSFEARLALARIEWVEERQRLVTATIGIAIAAVCGFSSIIFIGLAVIVGFWDTPYRLAAAIAVAVVMLLAMVIGLVKVKGALSSPMFAETRAELARDWRKISDSLGSHPSSHPHSTRAPDVTILREGAIH